MRDLNSKNTITLSEFEQLLHKATSNELIFPTERDLLVIASQAKDPENARITVKHIFKKLQSPKDKWRKTYKTLCLIETLLLKGNKLVYNEIGSKIFLIQALVSMYEKEIPDLGGQGLLNSYCEGKGNHVLIKSNAAQWSNPNRVSKTKAIRFKQEFEG